MVAALLFLDGARAEATMDIEVRPSDGASVAKLQTPGCRCKRDVDVSKLWRWWHVGPWCSVAMHVQQWLTDVRRCCRRKETKAYDVSMSRAETDLTYSWLMSQRLVFLEAAIKAGDFDLASSRVTKGIATEVLMVTNLRSHDKFKALNPTRRRMQA